MTLSHGDDASRSLHSVDGGAWGSDDDAGQRQLSRKPPAVRARHSDIRADANPAASGPAVDTHRSIQRRQASLPTLQALCIWSLGGVLPDLLEVGESVLPFLPAHCKAALFARAKRQGQLDDRALRLLVDADWSALDVSGCTRLTGDGLLAALRLTPAVRQLDVTNCSAGAAVLRALPSLCPRITVLRIGGGTAADEAAASALRHIAPQIRQPDAAQESWELAASDDSAGADVSDRLTQLMHVVWPAIPERLQQRLAVQCPKLQINAFKNAVSGRQVPPEADPSRTLDALLLESWGLQAAQQSQEPAAQKPGSVDAAQPLSVAERFRRAYEQRDQQQAEKTLKALRQAARNEAQRKRRALRQAGSATLEVKRLLCEDW